MTISAEEWAVRAQQSELVLARIWAFRADAEAAGLSGKATLRELHRILTEDSRAT